MTKEICIVAELYWPFTGGHQVRLMRLVDNLPSDIIVNVLTVDHTGNLPKTETVGRTRIFRLVSDKKYYKSSFLGRSIPTLINFSVRSAIFLVKNRIKKVLFSQFSVFSMFFSVIFGNLEYTAVDFVEYRNSKLWKFLNFYICKNSDLVISNSPDNFNRLSLISKNQSLIITPVKVQKDNLLTDQYQFLKPFAIFIGRLEDHKNPLLAIQAIQKYNQNNGNHLNLVIVGDGSQYLTLKNEIKDDRIHLLGSISNQEKYSLLSRAEFILITSFREGLPEVCLEAISFDVPTITVSQPENGTSEFVKQYKLGIVATPNSEDVSIAIKNLLKNINEYHKNCKIARETLDLDNSHALIAKVFEGLIYG